jgi:ribonuclease HI
MDTLAIRDGAILVRDRGYTKVIIEGDSKEVVNLCNAEGEN